MRFCLRRGRNEYTLRDVLFLGDALSGAAPLRYRRRIHAAYCALVHKRAAAELSMLLVPFAVLKLAAAVWVRFGRRARRETITYFVPVWWVASRRRATPSSGRGDGDGDSSAGTAVKLEGFGAVAAAGMGLASEVYMAAIFLTVCMIFRLVCALTLLKLNAFLVMIQDAPGGAHVLLFPARILSP